MKWVKFLSDISHYASVALHALRRIGKAEDETVRQVTAEVLDYAIPRLPGHMTPAEFEERAGAIVRAVYRLLVALSGEDDKPPKA